MGALIGKLRKMLAADHRNLMIKAFDGEGDAPAEPLTPAGRRLGRSLALPNWIKAGGHSPPYGLPPAVAS